MIAGSSLLPPGGSVAGGSVAGGTPSPVIEMSAQPIKFSCGPQPTHSVPSGSMPHVFPIATGMTFLSLKSFQNNTYYKTWKYNTCPYHATATSIPESEVRAKYM